MGWRSGEGWGGPGHLGGSSQEEGAGALCCSPGGKRAEPGQPSPWRETRGSRLLPTLTRLRVCSEGLCPPLPRWGGKEYGHRVVRSSL